MFILFCFMTIILSFKILITLQENNHTDNNCTDYDLQKTIGISIMDDYLIQFVDTEPSIRRLPIKVWQHSHPIAINPNSKHKINMNINDKTKTFEIELGWFINCGPTATFFQVDLMEWQHNSSIIKQNKLINLAWFQSSKTTKTLLMLKTNERKNYEQMFHTNDYFGYPTFDDFVFKHSTNLILITSKETLYCLKYEPYNNSLTIWQWNNQCECFNNFLGFLIFDTTGMKISLSSKSIENGFSKNFWSKYDFNYGFQLYYSENHCDPYDYSNWCGHWQIFLISNKQKSILSFNGDVLKKYYNEKYSFEWINFTDFFHCTKKNTDQTLDDQSNNGEKREKRSIQHH